MSQAKPIPIMHIWDQDDFKVIVNDYESINKIFLHPEVAERKVVVFTTIGVFRKGKSFFLDYCLRFLYANYRTTTNSSPIGSSANWLGSPDEPLTNGFSWKPGRNADTKGIIVWSDVFLHDTPTEKLAIIVMDTQGLFENGSTTKENSRIFGLGTLIASIQIINLQDLVQEDHLEYLAMATSLSQMVLKKVQSESELENQNFKMFQKLIFLIRDWRDDGIDLGFKGGKIYLEEFLSGTNYRSKEAQSVRQHIHKCFEDIQCCLLPYPGQAVSKSSFLGHHGALNSEFVENLKMFIESILKPENLVKKSILGSEVLAKDFQVFINGYFEAFRSDTIPDVESILEMTIQKQIKTLIGECIKLYHSEVRNAVIDYTIEDRNEFCNSLEKIHENAIQSAANKFESAHKMQGSYGTQETELLDEINQSFEGFKKEHLNHYAATIEMTRTLKELKLSKAEMDMRLTEMMNNAREEARRNEEERAINHERTKIMMETNKMLREQIAELDKNCPRMVREDRYRDRCCIQ